MMPLTMAKAGETVTIKKITGKDEERNRNQGEGIGAGEHTLHEDQELYIAF